MGRKRDGRKGGLKFFPQGCSDTDMGLKGAVFLTFDFVLARAQAAAACDRAKASSNVNILASYHNTNSVNAPDGKVMLRPIKFQPPLF